MSSSFCPTCEEYLTRLSGDRRPHRCPPKWIVATEDGEVVADTFGRTAEYAALNYAGKIREWEGEDEAHVAVFGAEAGNAAMIEEFREMGIEQDKLPAVTEPEPSWSHYTIRAEMVVEYSAADAEEPDSWEAPEVDGDD